MASSGIVYPAAWGSSPWWWRPSVVGKESDVEGDSIVPVRENRRKAGCTASALLPGW